jgi:hypothetical protein
MLGRLLLGPRGGTGSGANTGAFARQYPDACPRSFPIESVPTANLTSVSGKAAGDSSLPLVSARYLVAHARPYLFRRKQCK